MADYLFGRNALIGAASFMLLIISGYATWHGMRDFIIGVSSTPTSQGQNLPGGMSISNDALVIAVVVALTFLMWLMLRETFGAKRHVRERLVTFPLYVFLAVWSIGFGYGFWWSLISGEEATRTGLAGLQEDARDATSVVAARLDAVRGQLDSVVSWSDGQMTREETSGGSCGTASGAGRGPLYNARRSVRDSINTLREGMTRSWFEPLQADVEQLKQSAAALGGGTVEERQRAFEARASDIRGRARNIAARSNQLGKSTAAEMRAIAAAVAIAPGASGFSCYDPTLAERLRQAAAQAEQPAELKLREAVFNEGPAGVANAVELVAQHRRLWLEPHCLSVLRRQAGGRPHRHRRADHGARPDRPARHHRHRSGAAGVGDPQSSEGAAVDPPVRCAQPADQGGDRYGDCAVGRRPRMGASAFRASQQGVLPRHPEPLRRRFPRTKTSSPGLSAMNQLAGVLSDLELVRWPKRGFRWGWLRVTKSELEHLKDEEAMASDTDLTEIRKRWFEEKGLDAAKAGRQHRDRPIRNHGLFSKAERALEIAGWSQGARDDVEIFRLVDSEGLTPILMVLNEARPARGGEITPSGQTQASV